MPSVRSFVDKEVVDKQGLTGLLTCFGQFRIMADGINASLGLWQMALMRLDFPTFERPIKAYSGRLLCGQVATSGLDITNLAVCIIAFSPISEETQ